MKLTINADGSQGADTKHKVFWVQGCTTPAGNTPGATPAGNKPGVLGAGTVTEPVTEPGASVLGDALTNPTTAAPAVAALGEAITPDAAVQGTAVQGSPSDASVLAGSLARTGSPIGRTLVLASLLLALGAVALCLGRTRLTARQS